MPIIEKMKVNPGIQNSGQLLNIIRNSASTQYQNIVPAVEYDSKQILNIGNIILNNPNLITEFTGLCGRIAKVILNTRSYKNPLAFAKKGRILEGETIEEIFVGMGSVFDYNFDNPNTSPFERYKPNVKSAFHIINYMKTYPLTVPRNQIRRAFVSRDGVIDFIKYLVNSMFTRAQFDEFQTTKYLLAKLVLQGNLPVMQIPSISKVNAEDILTLIRQNSTDMRFMNTNNIAGVDNYSDVDWQYFMVSSKFNAIVDVNVLASDFNMDKADFVGRKVIIDNFGKFDIPRLNELLKDTPGYVEPSQAEMDQLNSLGGVMFDKDFFQIYDFMDETWTNENGKLAYVNFFYQKQMAFSVSPFAPVIAFVPGTPSITSVKISPSSMNGLAGTYINLAADVETANFASQKVEWSTDSEGLDVYQDGTVGIQPTATGTLSVTATSVVDTTKSATASITVVPQQATAAASTYAAQTAKMKKSE